MPKKTTTKTPVRKPSTTTGPKPDSTITVPITSHVPVSDTVPGPDVVPAGRGPYTRKP
jgi:hypothetical protein